MKDMIAAIKLNNFCIVQDVGIPKVEKTTAQWMNACEELDKRLKCVWTGIDVDFWTHIVPESMYPSASRAKKKSEISRKLIKCTQRKARLRPEPITAKCRSRRFNDI